MIFTKESAHQQIEELLKVQTGLHINAESETQVELAGDLFVNCKSKGFTLIDTYAVQIVVPLCSDELPYVIDIEERISKDYLHRYESGILCLETDTKVRVQFIDGFSLTAWIQDYVEPFYFSYEYYQRYGEFPFGERGHGYQGILETYQELFEESDPVKVIALMKSISEHIYRGHSLCPCGSNQRLRHCHGRTVMKYYTDSRLRAIVQADYRCFESLINYYLEKHYEQSRYRKQAK